MGRKRGKYKTRCFDLERVKEYAKEHTVIQLAKEFNCSYSYMWNYLVDHEITCKRGTWVRVNRFRDYDVFKMAQTHTFKTVGEKYGITKQRVSQIVKQGIKEQWKV